MRALTPDAGVAFDQAAPPLLTGHACEGGGYTQRPFDPAPLLPVPALLPIELSAPPPSLPFVRSVAVAMSAGPLLVPLPVALTDELPVLLEFRSVELQAARLMVISPAISMPW